MLLPVQTAVSHFRVRIGTEQQTVQIHLRRFPVGGAFPLLQAVGAAHHLIYRMEAQVGHNLPQILRHIFQIIDHVFRFTAEPFPKRFILGTDAEGAGVQVAHPQHMAAQGNERTRTEGEQLRPEHGGNGHVPAGQDLAVHFDAHSVTKLIQQQGLLNFRQPQFPGNARMAHTGAGRCAGAAIKPADGDAVRFSLNHTRRNGTDTGTCRQLHTDVRILVGVLQVKDQFRQIFD